MMFNVLVARFRQEIGVLASLIVAIIGFQYFSDAQFVTIESWGGILTVAAELGIVALGVTILMIAGEFDLSVGSNFAMAGMVFALLTASLGWPALPAFISVLFMSAAIGLLNGVITLTAHIPSFITTLGGLLFWRGIVLAISGGWPVTASDSSTLTDILIANLGGGYRASVLWWLGLGMLSYLLLSWTRFGNWIYATGGSAVKARAVGVPVVHVKLGAFALTGLLAGLAGVMQFGRLGSFSPTYGTQLELEVIAVAVIGGTALSGGVGGAIGTMLGALLMGMMATGLVMAGAPVYWYRTFIGVILVSAVILNRRFAR